MMPAVTRSVLWDSAKAGVRDSLGTSLIGSTPESQATAKNPRASTGKRAYVFIGGTLPEKWWFGWGGMAGGSSSSRVSSASSFPTPLPYAGHARNPRWHSNLALVRTQPVQQRR